MPLMCPTLIAQGIRALVEQAEIGGSVIVMSIIGGVLMPMAMGCIAGKSGSQALAYIVPMVACIFVDIYSYTDLHIIRRGKEMLV